MQTLSEAANILISDIERPDNVTPEQYESTLRLFKAAASLAASDNIASIAAKKIADNIPYFEDKYAQHPEAVTDDIASIIATEYARALLPERQQ